MDAIVLAGGRASRLDGVAKPQLKVGGVTLLDRVLTATADARTTVVVGPRQPVARAVTWAREEPVGTGPVAAVAAALPALTGQVVLVLAADLPWIAGAIAPLLDAVPDDGVAMLVDGGGRRNHLAAAWRTSALRGAVGALPDTAGAAMRTLADGVPVVTVADPAGWGRDCDTPQDLDAIRAVTPPHS